MKRIKKIAVAFTMIFACSFSHANAQVKLEDILNGNIDLNTILGTAKVLSVKKGFNPVFSLGNYKINGVGILGEKLKGINLLGDILGKKQVADIMKMYKTYRTGLVVYKVLSSAGTVVTLVSTVKGLTADQNFNDKTVKAMLYPALTSLATGVITKLVTKKASYKAVDVFNGIAKKKLKDILSVAPASNTVGVGLYVQL